MNRYTKKLMYIIICIMFMNITTTYACDEDAIPIMTSTPNTHLICMGLEDTKTFGSASYDPDDGEDPGDGIANLKWDVFRYSYPTGYIEEWEAGSSFTFNPSALGLGAGYYSVDLNVLDNDHTDENSNYIRGWYVYNADNERWYGTRDVCLIDCDAQCDEYVSHGAGIDISYQITPEADSSYSWSDWSYNDVYIVLVDQDENFAMFVNIADLMEIPTVGEFSGSFHWDGKCGVAPFDCDYSYNAGDYIPPGNYQLWMYVEFTDYNYIYKQVDGITVNPFNILPAPTVNGAPIIINTTLDNSYSVAEQNEDRKVRITVQTNPATANVPVYFRTYDPDDKSSYETDTTGLDNHHTNFELGDLDLVSGYASITGFTPLTDASGNVFEVGIYTDGNGKAEVDLNITNQYAGDNYIVYAGPNLHPGAGTAVSTDLLIAWKRLYLERDNMYQKGATITATTSPDGDALDNDIITVDNSGDFSVNDNITFFANSGSPVNGQVKAILTTTSIRVTDLNTSFPKYSGIMIQGQTATYSAPTDYLGMTYGMDGDGSDGGVFVEFVDTTGGESIPKYTNLPNNNEIVGYCEYWFDHISNKSNCVQLVAAKAVYNGSKGGSSDSSNFSIILDDAHTGVNKAKMMKDTVVHEIGHQFAVSGAHVDSYNSHLNHLGAGHDDCLMTYASDDEDGEPEFCTDCIAEVRGEGDPL